MKGALLLLAVAMLSELSSCCMNENWWALFDKEGWATCRYNNYYINGLYRNDRHSWHTDEIFRLEEARCCPRSYPFYNQPSVCLSADWVHSFDREGWSTCPSGSFLRGLYRSGGNSIASIEYGKCCKPAYHPYYHGSCYNQDVASSFDSKGWSNCNAGYFLAGFWRGGCDKLYCIEKFKCCKMVAAAPALKSLSDVKTRVMDVTLDNLATLAHYLGYGWCAGCRGQYVGEDFRRNGDSWEADRKGPCKGYKADQRLKIHYKNFKFDVKKMQYGKAVIQQFIADSYDSGPVTNPDVHPSTVSVERTVTDTRTVTHSTTSSWSQSHELGITIGYQPPDSTGGMTASASYTFKYEKSTSKTDSTGTEQTKSFKITTSKVLKPHASVEWRIVVTKQRVTIPYTATVIAKFSAELDGFLRWGGGYSGKNPNFHVNHRGSGSRPTFRYNIGDANTPMYTALKQQSDRNMHPWQWNNVKQRYSSAQSVINHLTSEGYYEFPLSGQFEDVSGIRADIQWKTMNGKREVSEWTPALSFDLTGKEPKQVFPEAPKMDSNRPLYVAAPRMVPLGDENDDHEGEPPKVFPKPPKANIPRPKDLGEMFHENITQVLKPKMP